MAAAASGKSAAYERRDPMNGSEENAAFYRSGAGAPPGEHGLNSRWLTVQ